MVFKDYKSKKIVKHKIVRNENNTDYKQISKKNYKNNDG